MFSQRPMYFPCLYTLTHGSTCSHIDLVLEAKQTRLSWDLMETWNRNIIRSWYYVGNFGTAKLLKFPSNLTKRHFDVVSYFRKKNRFSAKFPSESFLELSNFFSNILMSFFNFSTRAFAVTLQNQCRKWMMPLMHFLPLQQVAQVYEDSILRHETHHEERPTARRRLDSI